MKNYSLLLISVCAIPLVTVSFAQKISGKNSKFDNLLSFQEQSGNWKIVGDVVMDTSPVTDGGGEVEHDYKRALKSIKYEPGQGILLNMNTNDQSSHLISKWEHGDINISFEVMLPKGSNSGIYLQGRYEVQLVDSWQVKEPTFADMGGIYQNWELQKEKKFPGKAPLVNSSKAPGVWQTVNISFKAPRFNDNGDKISNACFKKVVLNGVKIHSNVEVPWTTGAPIDESETAYGPIMLQGDHGPVAFRHLKYRLLAQ